MTSLQSSAKRAFDIGFTLLLFVLLSPLFLAVSILIMLDSRGGIFYKQKRAGQYGQPFAMYKFRSMVPNAENMGAGVYFSGPDDPRITKVGRFLRRFSIDELPQLINVLRGEMSLVGPRPALYYQVELYCARDYRRLDVKPGITGWSQVNGRDNLTWPQKHELDIWYIDNYSIPLDLKIICKTVKVVIKGIGIRYDLTPEKAGDFIKDKKEVDKK